MENEINGAILQIVKRADKCDKNTLVETFVKKRLPGGRVFPAGTYSRRF